MHRLVKTTVAIVSAVAIVILGFGVPADAKGPNSGQLAVKARERNCQISAVATLDRTEYPAAAFMQFRLYDENENQLDWTNHAFSSHETQRISTTFSPLTASSTPGVFFVGVFLMNSGGTAVASAGTPDMTIDCGLPLLA